MDDLSELFEHRVLARHAEAQQLSVVVKHRQAAVGVRADADAIQRCASLHHELERGLDGHGRGVLANSGGEVDAAALGREAKGVVE